MDDVLTTINVVAIGAAAQSLKMDYNHKKLISIALNGYEEEITVTKSARELLFEGRLIYKLNLVVAGTEQHIMPMAVTWLLLRKCRITAIL